MYVFTCLFVCHSVRNSVSSNVKTAKCVAAIISTSDSPITLVFRKLNAVTKFFK